MPGSSVTLKIEAISSVSGGNFQSPPWLEEDDEEKGRRQWRNVGVLGLGFGSGEEEGMEWDEEEEEDRVRVRVRKRRGRDRGRTRESIL